MIFQQWSVGGGDFKFAEEKGCLLQLVNTVAAHGMATQRAQRSTIMTLTRVQSQYKDGL